MPRARGHGSHRGRAGLRAPGRRRRSAPAPDDRVRGRRPRLGRGGRVRPIVLPPNGIPRFYLGGPAIAELRGTEPAGERVPEDWVGSTTAVFGQDELGLSRLPDGRFVRDAVAADPVAFFGPSHATRLGSDPGLLV